MVLVVTSLEISDSNVSLGNTESAEAAEASAASGLSSATVVKEEKDSSIFLGVVNAGFRNGGATTLGASWGVKKDFAGGFDDGVPKAENEPPAAADLAGDELLNTACLILVSHNHHRHRRKLYDARASRERGYEQLSDRFLATCAKGLVRSMGPVFWYSHSMGASNVRRSMAADVFLLQRYSWQWR